MFGIKELQKEVDYLRREVSDLQLENHKRKNSITDVENKTTYTVIKFNEGCLFSREEFSLQEVVTALLNHFNLELIKVKSNEKIVLEKKDKPVAK